MLSCLAWVALASNLFIGCARDETPIRHRVTKGERTYMLVFPPKHIPDEDRKRTALLYARGFEEGLKAPEIDTFFTWSPS